MPTVAEMQARYAAYVQYATEARKPVMGYNRWAKMFISTFYGKNVDTAIAYTDTDSMSVIEAEVIEPDPDPDALAVERQTYGAIIAMMRNHPQFTEYDLTGHLDIPLGDWVVRFDVRAIRAV